MKFLRTAYEEIVGLFVDDWRFAALIVLWIAAFKLAPHGSAGPFLSIVFFLGLAILTLIFAALKAKASR